MAMELYYRDANPDRIRDIPAVSISSNYSKAGYNVGSDAAEASSTATVINATAHSVAVGDIIIFTSGTLDGEAQEVSSVDTNSITVGTAFSGSPSATDTFNISRPGNFEGSAKLVIVSNQLNQDVFISLDGSTDHLWVNASSDLTLDLRGNNLQIDREGFIYVKENTTPTTGSLRIMVIK